MATKQGTPPPPPPPIPGLGVPETTTSFVEVRLVDWFADRLAKLFRKRR